MLYALLYVSESTLILPEEQVQVERIVNFSRGWNRSVDITGALMFTEINFAQFIEGPEAAIRDLFGKLKADSRHMNLTVFAEGSVEDRRFHGWSLAYCGPAMFLERQLRPFTRPRSGPPPRAAAKDLILLMKAFTSQSGER